LECIDILKEKGFKISNEAIHKGLKNVVHKARMETLCADPLIIFDGGHNENAIKNLEQNVQQYYKDKRRVYIVSILKTKDYKTNIKLLCKDKNAIFIFTSGNNKKRYVCKNKLYNEAKKYINYNIYKYELKEAIDVAKKAYSSDAILIVGSFYVYKTVCEVLNNDKNREC
jgi:dihydrofolate synthase/folylpolyglutamate synthase